VYLKILSIFKSFETDHDASKLSHCAMYPGGEFLREGKQLSHSKHIAISLKEHATNNIFYIYTATYNNTEKYYFISGLYIFI